VRTPDRKSFLVKSDKGFILLGHRSNYDWMLFLTSLMAFTGVRTHDSEFTKRTLQLLEHSYTPYFEMVLLNVANIADFILQVGKKLLHI